MKSRFLMFLVLLAFVLANSAPAVKWVRKDDAQQTPNTGQTADPARKTPDTGQARQQPAPPPERKQPASNPGRQEGRGDDKFIDEDHDGINDKLQRPPETIKKKRDVKQEDPQRRRKSR